MKIVIVAAHRGDAGLALGLSVRKWLEQGYAVEVVSGFTRSEFAPFSDAGSLHANDRMSFISATRKREDEAWAKLYRGKLTMTELNLKDAPLRLHCGTDAVFGRAVDLAEKSAVKIQKAVERSKADALVLPLAVDEHIDRLTAREAGLSGQPSAMPVAFYEDLPQALAFSDEGLRNAATAVMLESKPVLGGEAATDAEEAVKFKRRVAWCYDSLIDESVTLEIAKFCERYGGRERLWANAAWRVAFGG